MWATSLLVGTTAPTGAFGTGCRRSVFDGGGVAPVVVADWGCPPVRSRRCAGGQARGCGAAPGWSPLLGGLEGRGGQVPMVWSRQPTLSAVQTPHHLGGGLRGRRRVFHVRGDGVMMGQAVTRGSSAGRGGAVGQGGRACWWRWRCRWVGRYWTLRLSFLFGIVIATIHASTRPQRIKENAKKQTTLNRCTAKR